jgi:hypothetical protein
MTAGAILALAVAGSQAWVTFDARARDLGPVVSPNNRRWAHGRIPYIFAADLRLLRARVDSAVEHIEAKVPA